VVADADSLYGDSSPVTQALSLNVTVWLGDNSDKVNSKSEPTYTHLFEPSTKVFHFVDFS